MDYEVIEGEAFTDALKPNPINMSAGQAARLAACEHLEQIIGAKLTLDICARPTASGYARALRFIIGAAACHRDPVW